MTRIAEEAGVSVGLVSRLLRGDPSLRITEERRKTILRIRDNLGGLKARNGQKRRVLTRTILAPVNRKFSPAWVSTNLASTQIMRGLEAALGAQDFRLHFGFFDEQHRREYYRSTINSRTCDGVLVLSGAADQWLADLMRQHEMPHVSFDFYAERFRINTVRAHTSDGIRQAVEHLRELGHERIGFLGTAPKAYRYPLVVAELSAAGLSIDERNHCLVPVLEIGEDEDRYVDSARDAMAAYIKRRGPKATALIAANDHYALGAIDAMRQAGLTPGREISLVGHDNLEVRGTDPVAEPMLTTIDNPYDLIGRRMGELLLNQIEHRQTQIVHERIPVELIVRKTTGPATC